MSAKWSQGVEHVVVHMRQLDALHVIRTLIMAGLPMPHRNSRTPLAQKPRKSSPQKTAPGITAGGRLTQWPPHCGK